MVITCPKTLDSCNQKDNNKIIYSPANKKEVSQEAQLIDHKGKDMSLAIHENRTDQINESQNKSFEHGSNELAQESQFEEHKACKMLKGVTKKIRKDKEKNFKLKTLIVK